MQSIKTKISEVKLNPNNPRLIKDDNFKKLVQSIKVCPNNVVNTVIASDSSPLLHYKQPNYISKNEICQIGTYPLDYDFQDVEPKYLIGMSVPPVMTAQIANQIRIQWLDKI